MCRCNAMPSLYILEYKHKQDTEFPAYYVSTGLMYTYNLPKFILQNIYINNSSLTYKKYLIYVCASV